MNISSVKNFFMARDLGLFLLRVSVGGLMIVHGVPKFLGGRETLEGLGSQMAIFGITFWPVFWGFMAAFSEVVGGLLLVVGFLVRPACFFLLCTMIVAVSYHVAEPGKGLSAIDNFNYFTSNPLSLAFVFLSLMFMGPGRFSVQKD